jgi:hypothetical protein
VVTFGAYPACHSTDTTLSSPRRTLFAERTTRLLVMWLLALVLPLQGAALGVFAAKGPAHLHKVAAATTPLELDDVRRWKVAPVAEPHVFAALGHIHAGSTPQRHHHARSDASVVVTAADAPDADEAVGASGLSVLALIPALTAPGAGRAAPPAVPHSGWQPRTGFTVPLDRPPRLG